MDHRVRRVLLGTHHPLALRRVASVPRDNRALLGRRVRHVQVVRVLCPVGSVCAHKQWRS